MVIVASRGGPCGKGRNKKLVVTATKVVVKPGSKIKLKPKLSVNSGKSKGKVQGKQSIKKSVSKKCAGSGAAGNSRPGSPLGKKLIKQEMVTSPLNGPRIQAQRKFAHAGNVYSGTLDSNNASPSCTPSKESIPTPRKRSVDSSLSSTAKKLIKKPPFSPPLSKRPKTEDFLTFLCFRGTPALPPELEFFNYSTGNETEDVSAQKQNCISHPSSVDKIKEQKSSDRDSLTKGALADLSKTSAQLILSKSDAFVKPKSKPKDKKEGTKLTNNVSKDESRLPNKPNLITKKADTACGSKSAAASTKAEDSTKGIRATASNVILSKLKKSLTTKRPLISPPRSRLNEQDARFAMTALKLKYQRIASSKPSHSQLLTKKVKERSVTRLARLTVLTRSKARTTIPLLSPNRTKFHTRPMKSVVISPSRNAPSPDIIFGVTSSTPPKKRPKPPLSESESHSETKSDSESESSSESVDDKSNDVPKSGKRSLRNGKELSSPKQNVAKKEGSSKSKAAGDRRVGTRSALRVTKSPLRELPMYNNIKRKITKKLLRRGREDLMSKNSKSSSVCNSKKGVSSQSVKKTENKISSKRPSRKTKETAALCLGLLTKEFSTDEDDSDRKGFDEDGDSDLGSSSSSETKFLEKHYQTALKRVKESRTDTKKPAKVRSTRSKSNESNTKTIKPTDKINGKKEAAKNVNGRNKTNRLLRGGDIKSADTNFSKHERSIQEFNKKMPGAARKSASIVCRRKPSYSSSSDDDENKSSDKDEESSDEDERQVKNCAKSNAKNEKSIKSKSVKKSKIKMHHQETSEESNDDCKISKKVKKKISNTAISKNSKQLRKSNAKESSKSSDSDSSDEDEPNRNYRKAALEKTSNSKNVANGKRKLGLKGTSKRKSEDLSIQQEVKELSFTIMDEDTKTVISEMRRLVEQKRAVEMTKETSSPLSILTDSPKREESPDIVEAVSRESSRPASPHSTSDDSSDNDSSSHSENEKPQPVIKVSVSTQCDMDLEEGIVPPLEADNSDDDVQEIGQVFSTSSTRSASHQFVASHHHIEEHSFVSENQTTWNHHRVNVEPPLHSIPQIPQQPPQFNPFGIPHSTSEFYTPLHLTPSPMVHSSIQLVGSTLGTPSFHSMPNPLNTLSIPVSVPHISSIASHHLLPHAPIGFATGSTFHSATATTLQTHIRSVATNLDIPLVRPVVGTSEHHHINFMGRGPMINAMGPLTRPPMTNVWSTPIGQSTMQTDRNPYSAFRVPLNNQVIHHQSTTVLGMNSTPLLPVSIVHPQQPQQQSYSQPYTTSTVSQPQRSSYPATSKPSRSSSHNQSGTSTSTSVGVDNTPPGYNIIKNLPNVSIVPKFDRSSKPSSQIPSHNSNNPTSTSGSSDTKKSQDNSVIQKNGAISDKPNERKPGKPGRKKKQSMILPQPSSPLTVRKDSNPATYAATSSKKSQRKEPSEDDTPKEDVQKDSNKVEKFTKLLKMKKASKEENRKKECPGPSSKQSDQKQYSDKSYSKSTKSKEKLNCSALKKVLPEPINGITQAPTYYPTDEEFEDPLKFIQKIQKEAEEYGMARIVPPRSFRPECNVEDDMRFTAYNHYIHKMYQRWGPNVLETQVIKENLRNSQVEVEDSPVIGGMEVNLSTLYQTVKSYGGLKEVIEKERWTKVADTMHVPKAAHDRATKLDAIYVKFVLPYEILSDSEREKLRKKVERAWKKRKDKVMKRIENSDDDSSDEDSMDELDECIVKGKTTPLSTYFRVARNTLNIFFPTDKAGTTEEIENEYWNIVRERNRHVCVYSGSIDCAGVGWGFPIPKASSKHPWNLKVLANNQGSVLRSMGPVMGATVPTLHVSMLFATYCWYRDPHSLPWVEYLHSGANKIWYSVASKHEEVFRKTISNLMPLQCKNKKIWLASDSAMVPPEVLNEKGVPLVRAVQNPGEFLVVFPRAYTSAICTGYLISESVCFAYSSWLETCMRTFQVIKDSKEPPVFSLEKLLISTLQDARASLEVVRMALSPTREIITEEMALRKRIHFLGVKYGGKITADSPGASDKSSTKKKAAAQEDETEQCYYCNYLLTLSMVRNKKSDSAMCLKHAVEHLSKHKADVKKSVLLYDLDEEQLEEIVDNASKRCASRKSPIQ